MDRKKTHVVKIRDRMIGGNNPVLIQSMNTTKTQDVDATLSQIQALANAGCAITRVAIPDNESAKALKTIVSRSPIPVVADIHFDYRLALLAIENGADKIRINPGNLGGEDRVIQVAEAARARKIPMRVGVNAGSLEKKLLHQYGGVCADALVLSAMHAIDTLERADFFDIVISIKSSDPMLTIESYRQLSKKTRYPLHIGVTEAGTPRDGVIRSAVGIGTLLAEGIGDTLRVSLTSDPLLEVDTGLRILKALGLKKGGIKIISCPTCGRTKIPLIALAEKIDQATCQLPYDLHVAVMGCVVNGPGEAAEADLGVAGGDNVFLLFKKGKPIRKILPENLLDELLDEIHKMGKEET